MTTEIITTQQNNIINYSDKGTIATLKETVAKGATDSEFKMFVEFCKGSGLNPFKKEIWFIKTSRGVQLMTGINGFFAVANNHPQFDGYESGLVLPDGSYASQGYPKDDYIGAWAKVYRKDRRVASEAVAMLKEYDKKQSVWISMRRIMIQKCAESLALRKAFPQELNGLYTQEEMPSDYSIKAVENQLPTADEQRGFKIADDKDLPNYVINESPNAPREYQGLMLCELDEDIFDKMSEDDSLKNSFSPKDLAHLRQYYLKYLHKGYKTKAEQKAKSDAPKISKEKQQQLEKGE